jgi:hypothetical protein
VQARRIALGDRTPVVLANLGSDRYHPGSLASERPVLVVRWGLLYPIWAACAAWGCLSELDLEGHFVCRSYSSTS